MLTAPLSLHFDRAVRRGHCRSFGSAGAEATREGQREEEGRVGGEYGSRQERERGVGNTPSAVTFDAGRRPAASWLRTQPARRTIIPGSVGEQKLPLTLE